MSDKKFHYYVLSTALLICVLVFADAFFAPSKLDNEVVIDGTAPVHGIAFRRTQQFYITTNKHIYQVEPAFYNDINISDTITIHRSIITNSLQQISILRNDHVYTYNEGFARGYFSAVLMFLVIAGIIVFLIFYEYLKNMQGRKNLTFFLLTVSVILLLLRLDIHIL